MLSTFRKVKGLVCRDIYFSTELTVPPMQEDLQLFLQATQGPHDDAVAFVTSVVDLSQSEAIIASGFKKSTSYDIRRGTEKDLVTVQVIDRPLPREIKVFSDFFDAFADAKNIGRANRPKLCALSDSGALTISFARCQGDLDELLVAHAYIVASGRARLLYSGTTMSSATPAERQIVGRANKCMHWKMLCHFKAAGMRLYDFGGLGKREELRSIDEFKESFGGSEIVEYNCTKGVTLKGKIALFLMQSVQRMRKLIKKN